MVRWLYLCWFVCLAAAVGAQSDEGPRLTLKAEAISRAEALRQIDEGLPVRVFFRPEQIPAGDIVLDLREVTVPEALAAILRGSSLSTVNYRDRVFVVGPITVIGTEFEDSYYAAVAERAGSTTSVSNPQGTRDRAQTQIGNLESLPASGIARISGSLDDDGEPIVGATIRVAEETDVATTTDADGSFELRLPPGKYRLLISYVGYGTQEREIAVNGSGELGLEISPASTNLQEVVVRERAADANVSRVQAGVAQLDLAELEKLPTFMGETDVLKALLLNPGVSTVGEGATGFNVRGGQIDQNLLLQDNALLLNSSHALGFFSTYHPDLLRSVDLYKANMPARFGGRLASVLDVEQRDGNFDHLRVKAGIGPVTSRIMLEGPIEKERSSFIFGARSSYTDWVLQLASQDNIKNSSAFFFDGNLRLTQRIGEGGTLVLSGYGSQDEFVYNNQFGFDYATVIGQTEYNQIFNDKVYGRLALAYGDYDSRQTDLGTLSGEVIENGVNYLIAKPVLNYDYSETLSLEAGAEVVQYRVNPGERRPEGAESQTIPAVLPEERATESSLFASAAFEASDALALEGGLRLMYYHNGDEDYTFTSLQPRLSARYRLGRRASLRAGYARTAQFINQLFLSAAPAPSAQFQLSRPGIPPFLSHNVSLGYFLNLNGNDIELGAEVYGRAIDQLWDFRDFADVVVNPKLVDEILVGDGRAYGLEISAKKESGQINGLISYTLSRTEQRVPGINAGQYYPSNFDKPHNAVLTLNWNPNQRNTLTANFTYGTGRPITAPVSNYRADNGLLIPIYTARNAVRIPDYHRLDLAYTLGKSYNQKRNLLTSWTISLYNVYARKNAFSVFYTQAPDQTNVANRLAVLGTVFPAITLNIETR